MFNLTIIYIYTVWTLTICFLKIGCAEQLLTVHHVISSRSKPRLQHIFTQVLWHLERPWCSPCGWTYLAIHFSTFQNLWKKQKKVALLLQKLLLSKVHLKKIVAPERPSQTDHPFAKLSPFLRQHHQTMESFFRPLKRRDPWRKWRLKRWKGITNNCFQIMS